VTFVLVHGGGMTGECWAPLAPLLDGPVLALDLPGRAGRPPDPASVTLDDFVDAVVDDLVSRDLHDVVLVGHSLAGITLPGVARRERARIRHLAFVSCAVPPAGESVNRILASLSPAAAAIVERLGADVLGPDGTLSDALARPMFGNDLDEQQWAFVRTCMVTEASQVIDAPTDVRLPVDLPRTYVRLLQDASLTVDTQDEMIANLGGADVVDLDAAHMAMISQPAALAAILNAL
jgi:pimeloyl-ACP methyl ester carboxylesterase